MGGSWSVSDYKKSFVWWVFDSVNSELKVVLSQFAHNLLDILEFRVSISEYNWNGIRVIEVGGFGRVGVPGALAKVLPGEV